MGATDQGAQIMLNACLNAFYFGTAVLSPQDAAVRRPPNWDPIVYFRSGEAELTWDARQVAAKVALYSAAQACDGGEPYRRFVVVGHADTAGSEAANLELARGRAEAVADALVREGVERSRIELQWKGEADPAVAGPDGTPEALNRRALIYMGW